MLRPWATARRFVDGHAAGRGSARGTRSTSRLLPVPASATTPTTCPLPARGLLEGVLERAQIRGAPDEAREPAAARHVEARARAAEAGEAVDAHRSRRRPSRGTRRDRSSAK